MVADDLQVTVRKSTPQRAINPLVTAHLDPMHARPNADGPRATTVAALRSWTDEAPDRHRVCTCPGWVTGLLPPAPDGTDDPDVVWWLEWVLASPYTGRLARTAELRSQVTTAPRATGHRGLDRTVARLAAGLSREMDARTGTRAHARTLTKTLAAAADSWRTLGTSWMTRDLRPLLEHTPAPHRVTGGTSDEELAAFARPLVWVHLTHARHGYSSPLAYLTEIPGDPRSVADLTAYLGDLRSVAAVPAAALVEADSNLYVALAVDDGYTADQVAAALTLTREPVDVTPMLAALKAAAGKARVRPTAPSAPSPAC